MSSTAVMPATTHQELAGRRSAASDLSDPVHQAFWLLRIGFTLAPILFGIDKFAHVLVNWDKYLAPEFVDLFNLQAHTLMYGVGAMRSWPVSLSRSVPDSVAIWWRRGWPGSSSTCCSSATTTTSRFVISVYCSRR